MGLCGIRLKMVKNGKEK
jgi:hypothetical protein